MSKQQPSDPIHRLNMDTKLIAREVWNPYKFPIQFRIDETMIDYLAKNGRQTKVKAFTLEPGKSIVVSHEYWHVECNGVTNLFLPQNLAEENWNKGIRWLPGPHEAGYEEIKKVIRTVNNG